MTESMSGKVELDQGTLSHGMPWYLIKVTVPVPWPKVVEHRIQASTIATAIARAVNKVRKELKGKRIKELSISARRI